jgi:PAS domain S-box-containing protein
MFSNSPGVAMPASRPPLVGLRDKLLSLSATARVALGRRGVVFASVAAFVGLLCCVGALADLALSLRTADVTHARREVHEILDLEQRNRILMRSLIARISGVQAMAGDDRVALLQALERVAGALARLCTQPDQATGSVAGVGEICAAGATVTKRLPGELAVFDPPRRMIAPEVMGEAILLATRINDASLAEARESDALVGRMVRHYGFSLLVLAASTCGFVAAGLILLVLVGRTSVLFHAQWREARQAQDRLQETIEALPAGVVLYDADERLVMFNSAAAVASPQLNQSNVVGKTYEQIAREAATNFAGLGTPLPGTPEDWIARFRSKGNVDIRQTVDGRWYEWREVATRSGATVGLRVDVTDLREAKRHAEEAREQYESLVDSLTDTVYKVDFRRGAITFASAAAAKLFGVPPATLIGRPFLDYVLPDDHEKVRKAVRAARYAADAVQQVQFRLVAADGTVRHVEDHFRRSMEEGDAVISGVIRDVSERVALSARLDQEMARLRSIVESSGALVMLTDAELNVVMVNREFEKFWNVSSDEMVGRPLRDTNTNTGLEPAQHARWLAGDARGPLRFVRTKTDARGRQRTLSITASPVADDRGILRLIVFLGVDDTERLEAELALSQSERLATVGEMAATVAH